MICVGIDVAKDKHDCFILSSEGEVLADVFTISNNAEGFDTLLQTIHRCARPEDKIKVGLEATGHYSYNILGFLLDKGLHTFVNDLDIYQNAMNFEAIAKQTDVKNIAEYRQIFEIGAIQLAAKRATEKNVTRLREILKKMEEVPEDSVALSQYDFEFHAYLMKMTHNELLIVMFNSIRNAYKNLTESIFAMGCLPTTINEHLAIVDAIADHDSALAAHMMQLHLSNIESFRNRQSAAAGKASEK